MNNNDKKIPWLALKIASLRIGQRLMIGMMLIVTMLVIPLIVVLGRSYSFQTRYNRTLDNLSDISYIIQETEAQGRRIIDYFTMEKNIEDSGEAEIIVEMLYRIKRIGENIGDDERYRANRETLLIVENLLKNYAGDFKSGAAKCGEKYSMAGDSDFYSMVDTADFIIKNCNRLQALEMNRSDDLKEEISTGFMNMYIFVIIGVIVMIILVIAIIYAVTRSITYPLELLMSHISAVSRSGLLDEEKQADDNDGEVSP